MARDRKRAKQRAQRRGARPGRPGDVPGGGSALTRADLPGSLEHVGDVDEFDAAIVRGAGGETLSAQDEEALAAIEAREEEERLGGRGNGRGNGLAAPPAPAGAGGPTEREVRPAGRPTGQSLPSRAVAFLRASWAELQRVQWPNRSQVTQATAVVLGFVAVAGVYFGVADYVAKEIVEAIL